MQSFISNPRRFTIFVIGVCFYVCSCQADDLLKPGQKVIFLGDSNTFAGGFVADFDTLTKVNGLKLKVINVGLPSETCCGLSEPDHPFPRPTVQERIDRVLAKVSPDVVVACYGMNDGIYHPFNEERFQKYQDGIRELISKVKKSNAQLILLTPPPFDRLPLEKKGKLADASSDKFAWFQVFEDYDGVLEKYSQWILEQNSKVDKIIDIRNPILSFLEKQRESNPDFTMSGDGVHFNATCHRIIAETLIKSLLTQPTLKTPPPIRPLANKKMQILRDAWLTETGHKRPGIKKGMSMDEAEREVKTLDLRIQKLLEK